MAQDDRTPEERREPTAPLAERLLEWERRRTDHLMREHAWALAQIATRLTAIEARIGEALTPGQWVKALAGIGLPLLALWLTGSVETARQLLPHP